MRRLSDGIIVDVDEQALIDARLIGENHLGAGHERSFARRCICSPVLSGQRRPRGEDAAEPLAARRRLNVSIF